MENEKHTSREATLIDISGPPHGMMSGSDFEEEPPIVVPPLPPEWESEPPQIPAMPVQCQAAPDYEPKMYAVPQIPPPVYTQLPYAPMQNMPMGRVKAPFRRNCLIAGMLGLFLGGLGAHRFYLGYYKVGVVMLVAGLLTPVLAWMHIPPLVFFWGFVEGILCFTGNLRDADGNPLARW